MCVCEWVGGLVAGWVCVCVCVWVTETATERDLHHSALCVINCLTLSCHDKPFLEF